MDIIEPVLPSAPSRTSAAARPRISLREATIVLQADGAVTGIQGLAWLAGQRDDATRRELSELHAHATAEGWTDAELTRAQLACLRPRRAEINALGRAYLDALAPDVIDAAHRMRRAGASVELSGEVAVEALLGVASALGVTPTGIHAPRLRFDALGAYTGCDVGERASSVAHGHGTAATRVFVGTHPSAVIADRDVFMRYTGFIAHEGAAKDESVSSFGELASLLAA